MVSISPEESLPTELEMVMLALRPEVFSVAVTLRMPLTSTSKTTSRTASPARIGGIGARVNSPREVLSSQLTRSPWKTGNWTVCWFCRDISMDFLEWGGKSYIRHSCESSIDNVS
jgi:hypothetical protein